MKIKLIENSIFKLLAYLLNHTSRCHPYKSSSSESGLYEPLFCITGDCPFVNSSSPSLCPSLNYAGISQNLIDLSLEAVQSILVFSK